SAQLFTHKAPTRARATPLWTVQPSQRLTLTRNIPHQKQERIHPGLAMRMILPALFPAHIRHIRSTIARRLITAGWLSTCAQRRSLFTPDLFGQARAVLTSRPATSVGLRGSMAQSKIV